MIIISISRDNNIDKKHIFHWINIGENSHSDYYHYLYRYYNNMDNIGENSHA